MADPLSDDRNHPAEPRSSGARQALVFGLIILVVTGIALIPLYGILFPLNVDLAEHVIIGKLLYEKLSGTTGLDIEVSLFVAYRLIPFLFAGIIAVSNLLGISGDVLPRNIVILLVIVHAVLVSAIFYSASRGRGTRFHLFAAAMSIPVAAAVYTACWFIGFVNFTLGVTLLLPAIYLTENFLREGRPQQALYVFIPLFLVYTAHPFAPAFWLMWCFCRFVASLCDGSILREWRRVPFLGLIFLPIASYHYLATSGTELAPSGGAIWQNSPIIPLSEWVSVRLPELVSGELLKADNTATGAYLAAGILLLVLFSIVFSFFSPGRSARALALSGLLTLIVASLINEKFIPTPGPHWLAYTYRFTTAALAIASMTSALAIVYSWPRERPTGVARLAWIGLPLIFAIFSLLHLFQVRAAYARFDDAARPYMASVFAKQDPSNTRIPRGRWHPDGSFLSHYRCLRENDCNPVGTTFKNFGGDLYAVKVKGKLPEANAPGNQGIPASAFRASKGSGPGELLDPRGIAVDQSGNLFIADTGNGRVQKFDRAGFLVSSIGSKGSGYGEFQEPRGVAVARDGAVYVSDAAAGKLVKIAANGMTESEWKGGDRAFYGPGDIALDEAEQTLYILDQGNTRVVARDTRSGSATEFSVNVPGDQSISDPRGLGLAPDKILVADKGNNVVKVFDRSGKFLRQWSVAGWGEYIWQYPDIVYDDRSKLIFLTFGWENDIRSFDLDGKPAGFSYSSQSPDKLDRPGPIAIDTTGARSRLLVVNVAGSWVSGYDLPQKN